MMRRIAKLLEEGENPSRILMVTFTRTAAFDLSNQLQKLGIADADRVTASTLHSLCFKILARNEVATITKRQPRPLFRFEVEYLLSDLDPKFGSMADRKRLLEALVAGWCRNPGSHLGETGSPSEGDFERELHKWLSFHRAMLVGELVPLACSYLQTNPDCDYASKYGHVLVDEYQDLNRADQVVIDLLATNASLTVAGDDNQSIYGFRYANPQGILDFPANHPGTHSIALTECRRCPKTVIDLANRLIRKGSSNACRALQPCGKTVTGEAYLLRWKSPDEEINGLAEMVRSFLEKGNPKSAGEVLVLVPRKALGISFKEELSRLRIKADMALGDELFDTPVARKRMAVLQLLVHPTDRTALRCWFGLEVPADLSANYRKLRHLCESSGLTPLEVMDEVIEGKRDPHGFENLRESYSGLKSELGALGQLSGKEFLDGWLPNSNSQMRPLRSLIEGSVSHDTTPEEILDFITNYLARPEAPSSSLGVRIMTLHKAKGLQAHTVIVLGLVQGLIPSLPDAHDQSSLDEQRRLLYVAMTRAKHRLILSTWTTASQKVAFQLGASQLYWAGKGVKKIAESCFVPELDVPSSLKLDGSAFLMKLQRPNH